MTQPQLDRAVARSTGESLRTVRRLGFGLHSGPPIDLEPEDIALAVDCPFCGRPCAVPVGPAGSAPLAECDRCDIYFDYRPHEVYAAPATARRVVTAA